MTTRGSSTEISLDRGERELWAGEPRRGIVVRGSDVLFIPFSLAWAGFSLFWVFTVLRSRTPNPMALVIGIVVGVMGVYVSLGRLFADARRRARTQYVLSSERVIILSGGALQSLTLPTLNDVTLMPLRDGRGTIYFGARTLRPGVYQPPAFEMIANAGEVYAQIREAQQASVART